MIDKVDKPPARPTRKKRGNTNDPMEQNRIITICLADSRRIERNATHHDTRDFDNLEEMDWLVKSCRSPHADDTIVPSVLREAASLALSFLVARSKRETWFMGTKMKRSQILMKHTTLSGVETSKKKQSPLGIRRDQGIQYYKINKVMM